MPPKKAPKKARTSSSTIRKDLTIRRTLPTGTDYQLTVGSYTEQYCTGLAKALGLEIGPGVTVKYELTLVPVSTVQLVTVETNLKTGKKTIVAK